MDELKQSARPFTKEEMRCLLNKASDFRDGVYDVLDVIYGDGEHRKLSVVEACELCLYVYQLTVDDAALRLGVISVH
jgi:hypothetical protein